MDIVCRILTQFQLIHKKEEEKLKEKINDCLYNSEGILIKILHDVKQNDLDLSKIYFTMCISNFGHLVAFYCLLETYNNFFNCETEEEKERIIIELTMISLDDFSIFKKNQLEKFTKNQLENFYIEKFTTRVYHVIKDVVLNYAPSIWKTIHMLLYGDN